MIYEYRVYHILPGQMAREGERLAKVAFPLFQKHGMKVIGAWNPVIGGSSNQLIYMLGYEDLAQRERAWAAFQADPEWQKELSASAGGPPITSHIDNVILRPTAYSPMK